ncbi:NADH:ubiquinone oxidoreductase subunit F (NADH-binding), partial [Anaerosolibacter carboniphilus]|nr:NADH:ubiquinone oxidoreductase subunit F (NADH-binding) [Anaerosolibacter carboniphilus]
MKVIVGQGSCGIAAGANKVFMEFGEQIKNKNLNIELMSTGCIGMCYLEPIIDIMDDDGNKTTYTKVTPEMVEEIIEETIKKARKLDQYMMSDGDERNLQKQKRIALRNCGVMDPENIEAYIERGGYQGIEQCVTKMNPQEVIEVIKTSGLRGRGGAGFPTWFKWNAARQSIDTPKYIVCNADEGDPGAFMDRSILEGDSHSVIEGMLIAGYAIGATEGIIYVRAEYPLAILRLKKAIQQAKDKGFLGKNLFEGNRFDFDIRIKAGAGAFVCGEETALIASLEGERGMPRLKPPFPAQKGYWQKPTNINNVETFANVPWIIRNGG